MIDRVVSDLFELAKKVEGSLASEGYSPVEAENIVHMALARTYALYLCVMISAKLRKNPSDEDVKMFEELCDRIPHAAFDILTRRCKGGMKFFMYRFDGGGA